MVCDIRIQKIGSQIRAFKRISDNWKGNVGEAQVEDIQDIPERYKVWVKECEDHVLGGGLDILSIDLVQDKDGKEHLLEVNDTATGFSPFHKQEDDNLVRDLVIQRMTEQYNQEK